MDINRKIEELKVEAGELVDKIADLLREGNVRRIIIKDASGHTFMEIPLNIAAIGLIAAPLVSAVGALAAMVAKFTVVIERYEEPAKAETPPAAGPPETPPAA
jgi:hypothetical protein